jgi:diaminohydroxyphosphoribosylaminopyrimidine deaminase/5-amino-6-(5-phosphoribosylamino)uracil reductase
VTLEPCSTTGKTPPCTESILAAGIRRVFFGSLDPDPKNRGRATRWLRQRGVEVTSLKWEQQDKDLNKVFHHSCSSRTPYVILKVAMSLDGFITDSDGHSRWVTGEKARRKGHELRRQCNGILIGGGTCNADNPRLQVRLPGPKDWADPQKIILSGGLNLNPRCNLFSKAQKQPPWVITTPDASEKSDSFAEACIIPIPGAQGKIPVKKVLRTLRQKGITVLLVEGGAGIMSQFLKERCFNELHLFMAPRVFGGSALSWSGVPVLDGVANHSWLTLAGMEQLGEDCHLIYRCNKKS